VQQEIGMLAQTMRMLAVFAMTMLAGCGGKPEPVESPVTPPGVASDSAVEEAPGAPAESGVASTDEGGVRQREIERQIRDGELEAPAAVGYICDGDESVPVFASFYNQTDPPSAVITYGDRQTIAFAARTGSGARYTNADVDFREHQGEVTLVWSGERHLCKVVRAPA
jgi:membrane-bound inhibitor of C-type lysozyme